MVVENMFVRLEALVGDADEIEQIGRAIEDALIFDDLVFDDVAAVDDEIVILTQHGQVLHAQHRAHEMRLRKDEFGLADLFRMRVEIDLHRAVAAAEFLNEHRVAEEVAERAGAVHRDPQDWAALWLAVTNFENLADRLLRGPLPHDAEKRDLPVPGLAEKIPFKL
ncbi:MAG TPA: hypothetical protein VMG39_04415 [Pseudolabrys sp.]|nr:hypothetical protein [Pseudolabrys sp.]